MKLHDDPLSVRDVSVRYKEREVLKNMNFTVGRGQIHALLGLNGAGKTTTIRAICGLARFSGEIQILHAAPGSVAAGPLLGVMPQETGAWSGIRVEELVRYLAGLYAHPLDVIALLERLNLWALRRTTYRRLSGGERQLVNLAGAMVGRCPILILDEPTAGLDPHARRRVWSVLKDLRRAGAAILLTTHAMEEVDALADHVSFLQDSSIQADYAADQLKAHGGAETVFLEITGDSHD